MRTKTKEKWTTLSPDHFKLGEQIQVTGGRIWYVIEDPSVDYSYYPRTSLGNLVFESSGEIRKSLKTKADDITVWRH